MTEHTDGQVEDRTLCGGHCDDRGCTHVACARAARRAEIAVFTRRLTECGVSMKELVRASSRQTQHRGGAITARQMVAANPELYGPPGARQDLPVKALEGRLASDAKVSRRLRPYVIAMALIEGGDFPALQGYLLGP